MNECLTTPLHKINSAIGCQTNGIYLKRKEAICLHGHTFALFSSFRPWQQPSPVTHVYRSRCTPIPVTVGFIITEGVVPLCVWHVPSIRPTYSKKKRIIKASMTNMNMWWAPWLAISLQAGSHVWGGQEVMTRSWVPGYLYKCSVDLPVSVGCGALGFKEENTDVHARGGSSSRLLAAPDHAPEWSKSEIIV